MYSRVNYTLVGLFVVLFFAGAVWFALRLAKYDPSGDAYRRYKVYFKESVTGLAKDATVKLKGVDVGRVERIAIDPKHIEAVAVTLKIRKEIPIKRDMVAHLEPIGVTGLSTIVIEGGSDSAPLLRAEGGKIPVIASEPSWFTTAKSNIALLSENLNKIFAQTQKLLDDKNIAALQRLIASGTKAADALPLLEAEANRTLSTLRQTLDETRRFLAHTDKRLTTATEDFHAVKEDFATLKAQSIPALRTMRQSARNLDRTVKKFAKGLDRGDYNLRQIFDPMLRDIELLTAQISDLARQMEASPGDLLFKSRKARKAPGEE